MLFRWTLNKHLGRGVPSNCEFISLSVDVRNQLEIQEIKELCNFAKLTLPLTVPKFAISQSEAVSTVLISCDIKSLA